MDQIYREYSEKYKRVLHYAGIMKKEKVLFEKNDLIVLKDGNNDQDYDYSYFENCDLNESCIYHKITYALAILKKAENGIIVDQMKTIGWLNSILDENYVSYKTDLWYLHKGNWDDCYLDDDYDFLSAIEVYCYLFGKDETLALLDNINIEMSKLLKTIILLIEQYQNVCQEDQYSTLKHLLVLLFSQKLEKIDIENKEMVFVLLKNVIELKSIVLPLLILCEYYKKDFDEEWSSISKEVDRNLLKEQDTYMPYVNIEDYLGLDITDVLLYKYNIKDIPEGLMHYFYNLKDVYDTLNEKLIFDQSLLEVEKILLFMEEKYHLYPLESFIHELKNNYSKKYYILMKILEIVMHDCLEVELGRETVKLTLALFMNEKLRFEIFGF